MMSREDCFEKLETLVLDENRIVTYKVLSRELKIHVNEAKQYLSDFLMTQKTKEKISLHATYFLAGIEEKDGVKSLKVLVVSQRKLEKAKEKLSEVTSCHIYSVSRGIADECSLYRADQRYNQNCQESSKYSAIKPPTIEIRAPVLNRVNVGKNDSKATTLKKQDVGTSKNGVSSHVQKTDTTERPSKINASLADQVETIDIKKLELNENTIKKSNSELKKEKPNSLASLWQKNEEKTKVLKTETTKSDGKGKSKSPQETKKTPTNNILSMFSKQAAKNAGNGPKKETVGNSASVKKVEVSLHKEKVENVTSASKSETVISERKPSNSSNKRRKTAKKQIKPSSKQHNKSDSDDEFQPKKKKHRRITAFEDSDSNSECEEAQDKAQRSLLLPEEPIEHDMTNVPATPVSDDSEDPIPPTPPVLTHKGKKKICKTVLKTFMDEDGFMVTEKVKEMVTESESDEDPLPPKSSKEVPKTNQFSYRKQASLTSFFKHS